MRGNGNKTQAISSIEITSNNNVAKDTDNGLGNDSLQSIYKDYFSSTNKQVRFLIYYYNYYSFTSMSNLFNIFNIFCIDVITYSRS